MTRGMTVMQMTSVLALTGLVLPGLLLSALVFLAFVLSARPLLAAAQSASVPPAGPTRIVDLAHPLREGNPTWDGGKAGEKAFTHTTEGTPGKGFFVGSITVDEHFGTHFDAPAHLGGTQTVDQVPVDRLMRPGVRIDISDKVRTNDDYHLTMNDIKAFEQANGAIPDGAIVMVATGWDSRWTQPDRYRNERDKVKHFPGLSGEAATYLAETRRVAGIGIDTLSVDHGPSEDFIVHRTTHARGIYHIENATGLTALPPRGFTILVAPVNIVGGSGAPTRLFALFP